MPKDITPKEITPKEIKLFKANSSDFFQVIIFRPYFIWERKIFKSNGFFFYKICQDFIYI